MKYLIVGIVLIIGLFSISFLFKKGGSFSQNITETGSNLVVSPLDQDAKSPSKNADTETGTKTITNLNDKKMTSAILNTNMGNITIEFYRERAPKTVENFIKLASDGFYNKVKFHRVIKGFMIQGGDPLTKDDSKMALWGTGGPGYTFPDELGKDNKNDAGTIAMANSGPNTNGSQFFINVAANNFLDGKHTVFGRVTSGMDVVTKIENTPTNAGDRPLSAVVINSITLK